MFVVLLQRVSRGSSSVREVGASKNGFNATAMMTVGMGRMKEAVVSIQAISARVTDSYLTILASMSKIL